MHLKLRTIVLCKIQFFLMKTKVLFIYLFLCLLIYFNLFICWFVYLFIYTFCLFLRNLIRAKQKELDDLQNQILAILKSFSTYKGVHTWNQIRLKHIRTWRTLLMLCLTSFTIRTRRICNISHKFMIQVKRFSASKKSAAIMYK